jgi:hypothetical protein
VIVAEKPKPKLRLVRPIAINKLMGAIIHERLPDDEDAAELIEEGRGHGRRRQIR